MSSKMNAATINELKVAYDEPNKKSYKKGKFLGKVYSNNPLCLVLKLYYRLKICTTVPPCIV